jgi:hypothetical protein
MMERDQLEDLGVDGMMMMIIISLINTMGGREVD